MRKIEYFSSDDYIPEVSNLKFFSLIQDLKLAKYPINQKYSALVLEFAKYVNTKKSTLDKTIIDEIDKLLIAKFNTLINECEVDIKDGQMLNVLLRMNEPELKDAGMKFSREYKKLLVNRAALNYIPKEIQLRVDDAYKLLIGELRKIVFKPVLNLFSFDPSDPPIEAETDPELKLVLENGDPTLEQLREMVLGTFKAANINANITILDNKIIIANETDKS